MLAMIGATHSQGLTQMQTWSEMAQGGAESKPVVRKLEACMGTTRGHGKVIGGSAFRF